MEEATISPTKPLSTNNLNRIFLVILVLAVILGAGVGYNLASNNSKAKSTILTSNGGVPKNPQQDSKTFRDFAQGVIEKRGEPKRADEYIEGTHILKREGANPVALTSSVLDLSQYEGKKVKLYGETQKAIKEGWLMDVGKVVPL